MQGLFGLFLSDGIADYRTARRKQGLFGFFLDDDIADYRTARRGLTEPHGGDSLNRTDELTGLHEGTCWPARKGNLRRRDSWTGVHGGGWGFGDVGEKL